LGVLAPLKQHHGAYSYLVEEGLVADPDPLEVSRALRRAVMARVQASLPRNAELPTFFSGHEADGSPARSGDHLTFAFDVRHGRLLVVAPHVCGRRSPTREETKHLETLEQALAGFHELRAGSAGLLRIRTSIVEREGPLFAASRSWKSVTRYQVTRHAKNVGAAEALSADLRLECRRCGLPNVRVTPNELQGVPGVGLVGTARLDFEVAVEGPILLGRSRHLGGGLFASAEAEEDSA
jgi:CRISPR-associated protein Csb2